jgi:phosphoglycerate dehydrogenase-like enzyme
VLQCSDNEGVEALVKACKILRKSLKTTFIKEIDVHLFNEIIEIMKILVATEKPFAAAAVKGITTELETAGNQVVLLEKYTDNQQLLDAVADVDAMIVRSDKITPEVLDAAKNLKIVVRAGAGYDSIDTAYAKQREWWRKPPGQKSNAVAELVFVCWHMPCATSIMESRVQSERHETVIWLR